MSSSPNPNKSSPSNSSPKVALVHYWLNNMRGGEKVLEAVLDIYPDADIFTHVAKPEAISERLASRIKATSFISKLPGANRHYQKYLPLMPLALEQLDLSDYDLVISFESGPAKGIIAAPTATHICYCHSPMRYVWDMYHQYTRHAGLLKRLLMAPLLHYLRLWDVTTSHRVGHFIANSHYVKARIQQYYHREATVIHPPVAVDDFSIAEEQGDFYLLVGQLVDYKRADLAVEAFNHSGKNLVVIGDGEQFNALQKKAHGNIKLLGKQPFDVLLEHYRRCRALIFPGVEDFGIVPLEAMACGRPVIAYAKGGALETVVDGKTGIYFHEQSIQALNAAVDQFEAEQNSFKPAEIQQHAQGFSRQRFIDELEAHIERCLKQ